MSFFVIEQVEASHAMSYGPSPQGLPGSPNAYKDVQVRFVVYWPSQPGTFNAPSVVDTYVATGSTTTVTLLNSWRWSSPSVSFLVPMNGSFDVEVWLENKLASSKRVYCTQLNTIPLGNRQSFSWKLHTPSSTGTLSGNLSLDVVRLNTGTPTGSMSSKPATTSSVSSSSSSLSSSLSSSSLLSTNLTSTTSTTSKTRVMFTLTRKSSTPDSDSTPQFSTDMSSNYVPSPPAPPPISTKPSSRFAPMAPAVSGGSGSNEWKLKLPIMNEMSLSTSKTLCRGLWKHTEGSSEQELKQVEMMLHSVEMPIGLCSTKFLRTVCSTFGAIAIAEDSSLYYWSRDSANEKYVEGGPVPSLAGKVIVDIAAGHDHYLALTIDGELFAWGANQFNQCTPGARSRVQTPTKVNFVPSRNILACAAGAHSSLAVDSEGMVWTWGKAQNSVTVPIDPFAPARVVADNSRPSTAPTHHTIVVDSLAHGSTAVSARADPRRVAEPTSIVLPEEALMVQGSLSSTMGLLVARSGQVYAWGDANAMCATSPDAYAPTPVKVPFPEDIRIVRALAGDYHALALDATGTLWSWGHRFFGGKMAPNAPSSPLLQPVALGSVVIDFGITAAGAAALTANGDIFTWEAFSSPRKASVTDNNSLTHNVVGVSHGTSSSHAYFLLGNSNRSRQDSVADLAKMASQIYDLPYDSDPESDFEALEALGSEAE